MTSAALACLVLLCGAHLLSCDAAYSRLCCSHDPSTALLHGAVRQRLKNVRLNERMENLNNNDVRREKYKDFIVNND